MRILIVEDQKTSALYLRRLLEQLGHEVLTAADGAEAWRVTEEQPISLVISDWMMPNMDGLELCRRVREREGDRYTYVILLTAKDRREDRLEGLSAGADDFLTKPPDADELTIRLEIARRILSVHETLHRQNALLANLATTDELTGVKNRRRFREDLEMLFALSLRQETPLSLVMLDVDHFKRYNDSFGHPAGDTVLRQVAATLRGNVRAQDVVARYGGEEFVILLPATGPAAAVELAERLRSKIEEQTGLERAVTASLGIATNSRVIASESALLEAADQALYRAKQLGRNRVVHHRQTALEPADEAS